MLPPEFVARLSSQSLLPEPLPGDPMPLFAAWLKEEVAAARQPNPTAMTLATLGPEGPRARVVLCRGVDVSQGHLTFFTNYEGDKGRELAAKAVAAAVFHWDASDRQVRIEGPVVKSPAAESDAYFASRKWEARLSAWASRQSKPLASRGALIERVAEVLQELGLRAGEFLEHGDAVAVPRPPHWGGFRLIAQRVELWLGGPGRLHDRARWTRAVHVEGTAVKIDSGWTVVRLQP